MEERVAAPPQWAILAKALRQALRNLFQDNTVSYIILAIFSVIDGALMRNESTTGITLLNNAYPLSTWLGTLAVFFTLAAAMRLRDPNYRMNLGTVFGLIAVALMSAIGTLLALLCLVVPGIWVGTKFSLAPYVFVLRAKEAPYSATDALSESWEITTGYFWPTVSLFLMVFGILGVPMLLFEIGCLTLFQHTHASAYVSAPILVLLGIYVTQVSNLTLLEWTSRLRAVPIHASSSP